MVLWGWRISCPLYERSWQRLPSATGDPLKLGVEEVTVDLDIAVTVAKKGEVSAKAKAKFWVFASVEGSVVRGHEKVPVLRGALVRAESHPASDVDP